MNSSKYLITFPLGTSEQMSRLDQLFLEGSFHPVDDRGKSLSDLLAIPLKKSLERKRTQSKQPKSISGIFLMRYMVVCTAVIQQ